MAKHITKDGVVIDIDKMSDHHLKNMIDMIKRYAKNGMIVQHGGGFDPDNFWFYEERLYEEDVYDYFSYHKYKKEWKKRKKFRKFLNKMINKYKSEINNF